MYSLVPEKIVLKTRNTKKAYIDSMKQMCDEKKVPEKVRDFLLNFEVHITYIPKKIEPRLVDKDLNEKYTNDGKCLFRVYSCSEDYTIKSGIEEVSAYAIKTTVNRITIPSSVKIIGQGVLRTQSNIAHLRFEGVVDDICNSSIKLYGQDKVSVIEVPRGTKSHYDQLLPILTEYIIEYDE